ncbi:MAG: hypothetical protein QM528_03325 [Phycisphaerales bacterium]|nr:hypothetical protein [Phycisphaerales bacterium]
MKGVAKQGERSGYRKWAKVNISKKASGSSRIVIRTLVNLT